MVKEYLNKRTTLSENLNVELSLSKLFWKPANP